MDMNIASLTSTQQAGFNNASMVFNSLAGTGASGDKLETAAAGAAELIVANELSAAVAGIKQGMHNAQDGISMIQVAEGSLNVISDNIVRMQQLSIQAQSSVLSDQQKQLISKEYDELALMNEQITAGTAFNGINLLEGGQTITITSDGKETLSLLTKATQTGKLSLLDNLETALEELNLAAESVSSYRAELGSAMGSLERVSDSLAMQAEHMMEAESSIRDIDAASLIAAETSKDILEMSLTAKQAHNKSVKQLAGMLFE